MSVYLVSAWLVQIRRRSSTGREVVAYLFTSVLVIASPLTEFPAAVIAGVLVLLTALTVTSFQPAE